MPKKTSPTPEAAAHPPTSAGRLDVPKPKTASGAVLKRLLPAASLARAKKAFKSFSLSRFAKDETPSNYVAAGQHHSEVQKRMISKVIDRLKNADAPTRGMTIALPDSAAKQLLPSLDAKARTIDLDEVIRLIQKNMNGTEFYANGNPSLNRLAVRAQVQQIISSIKHGGAK
jgi:hypothetical protein